MGPPGRRGSHSQGATELGRDRRLPAGAKVSAAQHSPAQHGAVQYYVIVTGHSRAASGLARRTYAEGGPIDETLRKDLTWRPDSAIVEWEYGDLSEELIEISELEADNLTQAFRSRWTRAS
jgi:hypothetical protein